MDHCDGHLSVSSPTAGRSHSEAGEECFYRPDHCAAQTRPRLARKSPGGGGGGVTPPCGPHPSHSGMRAMRPFSLCQGADTTVCACVCMHAHMCIRVCWCVCTFARVRVCGYMCTFACVCTCGAFEPENGNRVPICLTAKTPVCPSVGLGGSHLCSHQTF